MSDREESVKKPNWIVRAAARVARWLREMRSELKKVVWPTRKQLINNTIIVIVSVLIVGAVIGVIDLILSQGINYLITTVKG